MAQGKIDDPFYFTLSDGTNSTYGSINNAGVWKVSPGLATDQGEVDVNTLRVVVAGNSAVSVTAGNSLLVDQLSGSNWSVYAQNPSGQGDSATALRVIQAGDAGVSVSVTAALPAGTNIIGALSANQSINNAQVSGNTISVGDGEVGVGTMRIVHAADIGASVSATQVGTWNVTVNTALPTGTNTIGALSANQSINNAQWNGVATSNGDERAAGTLRVVHVGDTGASVTATQTGTWNVTVNTALPTGTNTLGAVTLSGSLTSAVVTGVTLQGVADVGEAPVKIGGIGITANPTAVAGGQIVTARFDKIGRQLVIPYQVRDLIGSAYITLATSAGYNTETTLIAAGATGVFNDIISIYGTNDSSVAAIFDLRDGTAAGVNRRLIIPAGSTLMENFNAPLPQSAAGVSSWTVKNAATGTDTTGTNVTFSAIYAKNV